MSDISLSAQIKCLCQDYYEQRIDWKNYRRQRSELLRQLDLQYNGNPTDSLKQPLPEDNDTTLIMETIPCMNNNVVDPDL